MNSKTGSMISFAFYNSGPKKKELGLLSAANIPWVSRMTWKLGLLMLSTNLSIWVIMSTVSAANPIKKDVENDITDWLERLKIDNVTSKLKEFGVTQLQHLSKLNEEKIDSVNTNFEGN